MSNEQSPLASDGKSPAAAPGHQAVAAAAQDATPGAGCAAVCPLAQIPTPVWKSLLRRPFRKRHPFLFWSGAILLTLICLFFFSRDETGRSLFSGGDRLALVTLRGPIMDVAPTLAWIRKIERDPSVKGVLLRVDSPGGGAAASQEVYAALARVAKKRPVAVSMGSMAASGGLMVSMAGKRIFANPSTVTGSIGVRMDIPQLQGLLGKIGVGQETLVTAPYKNAGSYLHPLSPEDRAYFEGVLRDMHEQFVDIVAQGRAMPRERAAALANGKIFTGREALKLGLVDEMGGQEAAVRWLAGHTGVPADRKLLRRPEKNSWLTAGLKSWFGLDLAAMAALSGLNATGSGWRAPAFLYQF
ncbi:signal peptide peptidase SppA [Desulfovibrio sp. ZJ200]|uniref:signal peptide peptidase SppA n=1 Tax=Desulfovibrio sp. ZJ200 TaxID=2709792 RepID=UPI0013EC4749|nr:signal peptide peptidase SppA [Desulfovibrio sp. ZJ200]